MIGRIRFGAARPAYMRSIYARRLRKLTLYCGNRRLALAGSGLASRPMQYNGPVPEFAFYHPIEVRYGDLDPQGHLNSARYMTFFEQARLQYLRHVGLWRSPDFLDLGIIVVDAQVSYLAQVFFGQHVQVGMRVSRLGRKSLTSEYVLEDQDTGQVMARGLIVLVAYDYHIRQTIPIPEDWRRLISAHEGLPLG